MSHSASAGYHTFFKLVPVLFEYSPGIMGESLDKRKCRFKKEVAGTILEKFGFKTFGQRKCLQVCKESNLLGRRNCLPWHSLALFAFSNESQDICKEELSVYKDNITAGGDVNVVEEECGCQYGSCEEVVYNVKVDSFLLDVEKMCQDKEYFHSLTWDMEAVEMFRQKVSINKGYLVGDG